MPNARMLAQAVAPHLVKAYGTRWYMITASTIDGKSVAQALVDASQAHKVEIVGETLTPFRLDGFWVGIDRGQREAADAIILNLYGWDLVNALKGYAKLELAKEKIGIGGLISGEQIGRPLGYAGNAGIWGLIWDPKINTERSKRFIQGVIDKYNHTPTSRCYLGYAAMTQILEAMQRAGSTETQALDQGLEGHEFDGLKEGKSYFVPQTISTSRMCSSGKRTGKSWAWAIIRFSRRFRGRPTPALPFNSYANTKAVRRRERNDAPPATCRPLMVRELRPGGLMPVRIGRIPSAVLMRSEQLST